jgi:hypothetical protein
MVLFSGNGTNIEFSHQSQNGFAIDLACYNVDMAKETAFQVRSLASDAWIIGFIHSHLSLGPHLHLGKIYIHGLDESHVVGLRKISCGIGFPG